MAARKKVRASSRKKSQVAFNMPPEMRAAMGGGPAAGATTQSRTVRDRIFPKMLHKPATDNSMDSEYFDSIEETIYWRPETPRERSAYVVDLGTQKITIACVKAVFLRARDENGDRIFTAEQDFNAMMEQGKCEIFEDIGAQMLGIAEDGDDDEKPLETTVASEKEE